MLGCANPVTMSASVACSGICGPKVLNGVRYNRNLASGLYRSPVLNIEAEFPLCLLHVPRMSCMNVWGGENDIVRVLLLCLGLSDTPVE